MPTRSQRARRYVLGAMGHDRRAHTAASLCEDSRGRYSIERIQAALDRARHQGLVVSTPPADGDDETWSLSEAGLAWSDQARDAAEQRRAERGRRAGV